MGETGETCRVYWMNVFFFMDLWYTWDFMGFEYVDATLDILNLYIYIYTYTHVLKQFTN